jgi:hypothetical protein
MVLQISGFGKRRCQMINQPVPPTVSSSIRKVG